MAPTISNASELKGSRPALPKTAIVHALENSPDDGSILLSSFHGAGGAFGDEIDPQIEIKGFGALPQEVSETTYTTLKSEHALKFPPEFEQAHRETLAHEAFIPSPKFVIGDPKWKAKVSGILQRLNVQDVFDLRSTGLLVSRHGTPASAIYCNPAPEVAGAIVIVLPNAFKGARVTTRHGARQETFVVDSSSGSRYNYIAWLQNCFVGVTPLESGFRVALAYDIVRRVPPPSPDSTGELADLQQILQYWVSNPQNTPKQLVYYLRDPFEVISGVEEIPPMALSQMSFIRKAGESLGFQSRIACLTYTVRGRTSEKESEDSPGDLSQVDLVDVLEERMQLEDLRGPDGLSSSFSSRTELTMLPEELLGYSPKELFDGRTEKPEEARGATERDSGVLVSD
ncbi:hypothetical protein FRC04_003959 [Tulasnella sp. 424]|nr:hypothetical protein FRC04_003959 [Tulasnella sp. 424]KAG8965195.1 hypothetical protein FRC05_003338 [Tulasnella sp. 425]